MTFPNDRPYDLVVYGATSFVGKIICAHLAERLAGSDISWAIAARNPAKLDEVATSLGLSVDHFIADASDPVALEAMTASTRVLLSTVGPYSLYGSELIAAVIKTGTDYCDLTGEAHWMQKMIDLHQDDATLSGSRIVHACGFDSIPSDMGVAYTQRIATELLGEPCRQIAMRVKAMKGGASGGTIASMMNIMEEAKTNPEIRRIFANPYALAPAGLRSGVRQNNVTAPMKDDSSGRWVAPFVMAAVNTRVVFRSHALMGSPWGEQFMYDEAMIAGDGPAGAAKAGAMAGGMGAFMAASSVGPLRKVLGDRVLPKPGEGPSPEAQRNGFFDLRFYGSTEPGATITTRVTGDRDPGYGSTAKMISEAALMLLDVDPANTPGGFWTPSTAFGQALEDRLVEHAGLTFEIVHSS